ncbi:MAG: HEAT repeat domain-containing protein [Bryobacterales bacterium]|nr:HEAT repeat domain-containing protein [Bryobacterales bacterium]MBV9400382.1 HEAT repeat domain-containing protein [Bryobacterales bacterium]
MNPLTVFALIATMRDPSRTVAQRNDGCYALRGLSAPPIVRVMRNTLQDPAVRSCAGINLRIAGAIPELKDALADPDPQVRALAARQLGAFEKPELLPMLAEAAQDQQLLVAVNAVEAIAGYRDIAAVPYLLEIAKLGGIAGNAALNQALEFRDPRVPVVARDLLNRPDISDKLAGIRALAQMGDAGDLPKLREFARAEMPAVAAQNRGFGLMPPISISKAAQTAIEAIENHQR